MTSRGRLTITAHAHAHDARAKSRVARIATMIVLAVAMSCGLLGASARNARAQMKPFQGSANETPPELQGVDIVEHLGAPLPGDAVFRDTSGKMVRLSSFFDGKRPVAFVFAYHSCPMLCSLVLDAFARGVKGVPWTVGKEYDVVSISIDPHDTPESATTKRQQIVEKYDRGGSVAGWHFLTGDEENIRRVTSAIGFQFRYDEGQKQYAHPAAMYLLTPGGKIARYLYGIEFPASDIRMGLLEASEGRSISTTERLLLYCYHYDPKGKKYALVAMNVMRLGGGITVVLLGGMIGMLWLRDKKKRARRDPSDPGSPTTKITNANAAVATPATTTATAQTP